MADKEATLKLTLKSDGFKAGLSDAEAAAKKAGSNIGKGLSSAMSDAGKAGLDALKGSLMNLKSAVAGIAGIAGGFGIVEFARRAIAGEAAFKKLAFQIRAGTGEMLNWRDMQREAQATALKFGHSTEEVGKSISDLYAAVGDTKFAREASKVVAEFATGAHEPLEVMTNLAGGLNEKFGVTAKELPDVLATVVSLGNKGGVSVADLADKIGIIGANARMAGLDGAKGFGTMVSWLNIADNATGTLKKGIAGVSGIIDSFATGAIDKPLKTMGIDVPAMRKAGADFNQIIGKVFEKTGGKEGALAKIFSGDQLKVISEMGRTYAQAFDETEGNVKTKTKAALEAFENALQEAGKSQLDAKAIQEEAAREMETPEKKIATAMEKLAQTFTDEKFMSAFKELADFIPKVVEQMMKHPLLTGALLSGVPQAIAGSLAKSLTESIAKGLGSSMKGMGGAAFAIGALGLGAYEGGKALIDAKLERDQIMQDNTRSAGIEGMNSLSASRTMIGNRDQFGQLATESAASAVELERRVKIAQSIAGYSSWGRKYDASTNTWGAAHASSKGYDQIAQDMAKEALPGGSAYDRDVWAQAAIEQAKADAKNMPILYQALQDAQQAAANFASRAAGTYGELDTNDMLRGQAGFVRGPASDAIGMTLHGASDEQFGLGLGGNVKTNRQKAQEEAAAKEEARVQAQKQDFAGLIDGITAPMKGVLLTKVVNPEDIRGDSSPKPGPEPR